MAGEASFNRDRTEEVDWLKTPEEETVPMKRAVIFGIVLGLICLQPGVSPAQKLETLAELKARAAGMPPEECIKICAAVARRALEESKEQFAKGSVEEAKDLLRDVQTYADKAADATIQTRKHEKQLEIDLRDLMHRVEALKRSLSFEDQPAAEAAREHLEKLRTRLLESMFSKGRK